MGFVITYLILGLIIVFIFEGMVRIFQTGEEFSNRERLLISILWPLSIMIFVISFINESFKPPK
tara:strand:+ start:510 stop:701 length:192 start_codon:yes stop_codon:yes gene_type:complete